jgi:hypothetical protein
MAIAADRRLYNSHGSVSRGADAAAPECSCHAEQDCYCGWKLRSGSKRRLVGRVELGRSCDVNMKAVVMRALVVALGLVVLPARAEAWDPLKAAADKAGKLLDAAVAPTLDHGDRLLHDADHVLHDNLDRAGMLVTQVGTTFADVDRSLAARILQVQTVVDRTKTSVDGTIDHAFDRIDHTFGELDHEAEHLLDRADQLIQKVDGVVSSKLKEVDKMLTARIHDVQFVVSSSIQQADDVARARLDQLDELAGRRLGNIDVIASKQSLSLESMIGRLAVMITLIALFAFIAWRTFREIADALAAASQPPADAPRPPRRHPVVWRSLTRLAPQIILAAAGVVGLKLLAEHLPRDAERRACDQIAEHVAAFAAAVRGFDVTEARYHESQLEILVPGDIAGYRAKLKKVELLYSVFTRPGQLRSQRGLGELTTAVDEVERLNGTRDPDVMIAKAYVLWQVGGTRDDEHDAVALCADALRTGGAVLAPLARNYIAAFLARPYSAHNASSPELTDLARLAAQPAGPGELRQFARVIELDRRIMELDRASSAAYLDMLAAQADLQIALPRGAKSSAANAARTARNAAAERLVDAWRTFDAALAASPALAGDPIVLSVFALDDAVLTRARYYAVKPDATDLAPALTGESAKSLTPGQRARIAPLRIAWERRYGGLLGPSERDIVAYQETDRFAEFERRAQAFEQAYVAFHVAARNGVSAPRIVELATRAASAASQMSLYREKPTGRVTEASEILAIARSHGGEADATSQAEIARNYRLRGLHLL